MSKLADFEAWAERHPLKPPGRPCSVCLLPPDLLTVVHEAYEKGHKATILVRYLADKGQGHITCNRIENHFSKGHHVQAKAKRRRG